MKSRKWALYHSYLAFARRAGLERNLVDVSIAVGQSGDGFKEPPPWCRGGKRLGLFSPPHPRKPKGRKFRPKLPVAQTPAQTITNFGFWRCLLIADVQGASAHYAPVVLMWACLIVNRFSSVNRISSKFRGSTRRRSRRRRLSAVRSWTLWCLYGLSWSSCLAIRLTDSDEIPVSWEIFRIGTVEFRWTHFFMSWRFLVVLIGFLSRLGRSPVWPSSCNHLMVLLIFGGETPSVSTGCWCWCNVFFIRHIIMKT